MSKHTPGPWKHQHEKDGWFVSAGPYTVALAWEFSDGETENAADNARLMAAAPDLLEALKWYVETDEVSEMPGNEFWLEGRDRAIAAIAKATGND